MKRTPLHRHTSLPRPSTPMERGAMKRKRKPLSHWTKIKPLNAERQGRRKKRYQAYLKSAAWKLRRREALERAGHRCEMRLLDHTRCPVIDRLTVHHKTYARFGAELPTDLVVLCRDHHNAVHAAEGKRIA